MNKYIIDSINHKGELIETGVDLQILRQLRVDAGLTVEEFAGLADASKSTAEKYLSGERRLTPFKIYLITQRLGTSWLYEGGVRYVR